MKNEGVPRVAAHFYSGVPPHRIFSERLPKPLCDTGEPRNGAARRTVTDEGSPPLAGLTSAFTFAILWLAAVAASAPSEGFGFRAPPVADTARKASRCRPQVRERIAEARAANGEGAKVDACIKDLSRQTEGEIHRVCAKALDIGNSKGK